MISTPGHFDGKEIMRSNNGRRLGRNRKFVDSPLEEAGFELVVPDFRETFLLYRFRAANWPGATAGFDDR
jgi:hypothetical protein